MRCIGRRFWLAAVVLIAAFAVVASSLVAAAQEGQGPLGAAAPGTGGEKPRLPVYKPPLRGAPARTTGGGTRGAAKAVRLSALAPDHVGQTALEQPTLYWYAPEAAAGRIDFVLSDYRKPKPLVEATLPAAEAGIHAIRLADYGVRLEPNVSYDWSVAQVVDPEQRSADVVTAASIRRVDPAPDVQARLRQASRREQVFIDAEAGLWYDAYDTVAELRQASPHDTELAAQQEALLHQVGLDAVAVPPAR